MTPDSDLRYHLAVLTAMLIWSSSFIALKVAVNEVSPMVVIFLRMLAGSLVFLLFIPWLRKGFRYQKGDAKYLLGMALFEPCLYFIFEAAALQYTSAGQAGMVTSMLPLMVAVGAFLFLREQIAVRQWLGFLVAVAGVVWMTLSAADFSQAPNPLLGNFLEFMAMVSAVGYTLLVKHLARRYSVVVLTAIQTFTGVFFFAPLAAMAEWPETWNPGTLLVIGYLGVVVSIGAYGLYNYSLTRLSATTTAGYTNLLPVFTLFLSMLMLAEKIGLYQWLAIGLVFTGVAISQSGRRKRIEEALPATG